MANGGDCPKSKSWGTYPSERIDQLSEQYEYDSDHGNENLFKCVDEAGGTYKEEDPFASKCEVLDEEDDNYESQMCKEVEKILSLKKRA